MNACSCVPLHLITRSTQSRPVRVDLLRRSLSLTLCPPSSDPDSCAPSPTWPATHELHTAGLCAPSN